LPKRTRFNEVYMLFYVIQSICLISNSLVRQLNSEGHSLGMIFRSLPVDFSDRFDEVLENNKDVCVLLVERRRMGIQFCPASRI
jgi:hypothetical protein